MNKRLEQYGLFVIFVGVFAVAAAVLGIFLLIGLTVAAGSAQTSNLYMFRDVVLGFVLGISALVSGSAMRSLSLPALRFWEISTWLIAMAALTVTAVSFATVSTGPEYLVSVIIYTLLAGSATLIRKQPV